MKKYLVITSVILLFVVSCKKQTKQNQLFDISKYVTLKTGQFKYEGKIFEYVDPKFVDRNDSISNKIKQNARRYRFLIKRRTGLKEISAVMPDSLKAKSMFLKAINKKEFKDYFYKTYFAQKEKFTEQELMSIASKFFFMEKTKNGFGARICIGINGLGNKKDKDYTLLEAIAFEAVFAGLRTKNKEKSNFMQNLDKYQTDAVKRLNGSVKDSLDFVRNSVFQSMENDEELKKYLLNYLKVNNKNVAVEIVR